jgi:1-acyl-sn-glycerol-3-phosphate acyltransferase
MTVPYRVPWPNRLARIVMRPIFRGLFHLLGRVRITGRENVPKSGAYLIAMNHISIYDPPFVVAFWPTTPEVAGAVEVWSKPGQSTLVHLYHGIPIHRGEYDRNVFERILAVLQAGHPLVIAPEGGRSHVPGMRKAYAGIAYVVGMAKVPVIPAGVVGTTDDFFQRALRGERPVIEMHIGCPIWLPPIQGKGEQRRKSRQDNVDQVMFQIASLMPPEYRGVYAQQEEQSHS